MDEQRQFSASLTATSPVRLSPAPKRRSLLIHWIPVALWMLLIFSASGDAKSAQHSAFFLDPLLNWLLPNASGAQRELVVLGIRKLAHVTEYAILAALVWRALRCWCNPLAPWKSSHALISLAVVVVYAITDELHQTFIPNRQGSPIDVAIDTFGGALALALIWLYGRFRKRW